MEKKTLNEIAKNFTDFLKTHTDPFSEEDERKCEVLARISSLSGPLAIKDILVAHLNFHEAINSLIAKEELAESKEEIEKLTAAVLKLCK